MFARSRFYTPKFELVAPRDWRGALAKLVRFLDRDDIRTVDALLAFVSRDYVASRMLAQLLEWFPMAKRKDGLVYKSGTDWQAETGISADQVKLRKANGALAELGIYWDIHKANKIPHSHYGFDVEVFVKHVAEKCGKLICEVKAICYLRTMPLGSGANGTGGRGESPQSLTEIHSKTQLGSVNDSSSPSGKILSFGSALEQKLVGAGLSRKDHPDKYAVLPMEIIDACIADTEQAQADNLIKYTPRAYLRGALNKQMEMMREGIHSVPTDTDDGRLEMTYTPDEVCAECGTIPHWFSKKCSCSEVEDDLSETSAADEVIFENGNTDRECWDATYNQLELQLDRASFDTWLKDAEFVAVRDGKFVVQVHNSYARDMLQYRLYRNVRRVLSSVVGKLTEVTFEIKG